MRPNKAAAFAVLLCAAAPAAAADALRFSISAGRLDDALIAIGEQAGVSIGVPPQAGGRRVGGISGRMTVDAALASLLANSGLRAIRIDDHTYRIEAALRIAMASRPLRPSGAVANDEPITVTASKQGTTLFRLPGAAAVLDLDRDTTIRTSRGTGAVVDNLSIVNATDLGPGRNKLFIRGIADSSFTGPTQSTVGQYLGDVRLSYNAPDPDLTLYDIAKVEVLEGPQGTLYGAGSLGGIIRLVPQPPTTERIEATIDGGVTATRGGATGYDIAAMANLPVSGMLAARGVAYRSVDGGYIDDVRRGLKDINRTTTRGGRLALRLTPGDDWAVDLSGVAQYIDTEDSQYSERGLPPLSRRSAIAQPFDNDFTLGRLEVQKVWGSGLTLSSATGAVGHEIDSTYDATSLRPARGPLAFREDSRIVLISHETRLSRSFGDGVGWVAGVGVIYDRDRTDRALGAADITGVINRTFEIAAFGEATVPLGARLNLTGGARLGYSHAEGGPIAPRGEPQFEPSQAEARVLPTVAMSWKLADQLSLFARYQDGFRGGGLSVARGIGVVARFQPDRLHTVEAGLRYGRGDGPLTASLVGSYARWKDIQADLISTLGFPVTANIGDGRVYGLEASADWTPLHGLSVSGAVFLDDSSLTDPAPAFARAGNSELPDNADVGARGSVALRRSIADGVDLVTTVAGRYISHSRLDVGSVFHFQQGDYTDLTASVGVETGRWRLAVIGDNLLDSRANRFAIGNPFGAAQGTQTTPPRPRNIRLAAGASF